MSAESTAPLHNALNQPIGAPLPDWTPPALPPREPLEGRLVVLTPLHAAAHAEALFAANAQDPDDSNWTYLPYGPFDDFAAYRQWLESVSHSDDPLFFSVISKDTGKPAGVASYLRIQPQNGSIEVGHIHFSKALQRTAAATEAMFLMMQQAFELGYRRYEWKCDALNAGSRAAAERLGLSFEGVFHQATVYKQRNRDTAWYAAVDGEWPALREAFEHWLDAENFDGAGRQRLRLSKLTAPLLKQRLEPAGPTG